jgi:ATP-binding cassette subfamily B protein
MMTEKKISDNLKSNYLNITLISITQKVDPVKDYDQIILLMEGEIIAKGKHEELINSCPEYIQIYQSQQSTTDIEAKI